MRSQNLGQTKYISKLEFWKFNPMLIHIILPFCANYVSHFLLLVTHSSIILWYAMLNTSATDKQHICNLIFHDKQLNFWLSEPNLKINMHVPLISNFANLHLLSWAKFKKYFLRSYLLKWLAEKGDIIHFQSSFINTYSHTDTHSSTPHHTNTPTHTRPFWTDVGSTVK